MKNSLSDLNNYLFESIERLMDDDLDDEGLERERKRAEAVYKGAKAIIENGRLALDAQMYADEYGDREEDHRIFLLEDKKEVKGCQDGTGGRKKRSAG